MYNYSGILYRIYAVAVPTFLLGLLLVIIALKMPLIKRKSELIFAGIVILISILLGCFYLYKSINPTISYCEGYIVEERGYNKVPVTTAYVFATDENDEKKIIYLDAFSRKSIIENKLFNDVKYRIFYEKDTRIIVLVEICE